MNSDRTKLRWRLVKLGFRNLPIKFFNSREDDPKSLKAFLIERVQHVRSGHKKRIADLIDTVERVIENRKKEQVQAIFREVMRKASYLDVKSSDIETLGEVVQQSLINAIAQSHPRTLWATVRRRGEWYNLDYYYHLGFGARAVAVKHITQRINEFKAIVQNLIDDPGLDSAHDFLRQVTLHLDSAAEALFKRVQVAGKSAFQDELKGDSGYWGDCDRVWGPGYRSTVTSLSDQWFRADARQVPHSLLRRIIMQGWEEILRDLEEFFKRHWVPSIVLRTHRAG